MSRKPFSQDGPVWLKGFLDDFYRILPYDKTGQRLPGLIKDMKLITIQGGPHAIAWTHADQVNQALLDFIAG